MRAPRLLSILEAFWSADDDVVGATDRSDRGVWFLILGSMHDMPVQEVGSILATRSTRDCDISDKV
jgi:hypothetical protein